MSEEKLISPLLDGFVMGDAISEHDGIRCYPAMRENSDEKYIVKVISIPASQKRLDALLLTGAFQDAAGATEYFKELSDGVVRDAQLLRQLAKLEGFLPYEGWQVAPMQDNKLGYEVYLVSPYKRSLEKHLRRNTMTHLGAVNLGLDLCAALSMCRRAGFLYVALKPGNIFLTGEREYKIGDLGFVKLNSLKYTSMPAQYLSPFTPPELHDALATLNPTVDIYAVGMILYMIYNNGVLPYETKAPNKLLPAPMNADYEMAEIIAKACHPNPRHRYQTPIEMGQALKDYMQRNTINNTPIVPPAADPVEEAPVKEEALSDDAISEPMDAAYGEIPEAPAAEIVPEPAEQPSDDLAFLEDLVADETAPGAESTDTDTDAEMSDEVSSILAQADELVKPAEEEASAVEPQEEEFPPVEDELGIRDLLAGTNPNVDVKSLLSHTEDEEDEEEAAAQEQDFFADAGRKTKKGRGRIAIVVIVLIFALLGAGGYYFYQNYYLLPIDLMNISCVEDTITVSLTTDVDQSLLTIVCTDSYGNTKSSKLTDGRAVFTELNPDTQYKFTVEAEGFHQVSGSYYSTYSTGKQTNIVEFTAKTGTEDGSVILNFTVDGPETQDWVVEYATEGEETQSLSFTGHMVTVNGLTVGKTYTFTLVPPPGTEQWLVGTNTLEFTASRIIVAEDVSIVSCIDGVLTAQWNVPEGAEVDSWTVRCYSDTGYDQTVTVSEASVEFSDIDTTKAYTVEVWASGMTQSTRAYVTANPSTITDINVDDSDPAGLKVTWNFSGTAPEGGWLLMYSLDGSESQEVITCTGAEATIEQRIPRATYDLTIKAADGSTVFGGIEQYTCPAAENLNANGAKTESITMNLLTTPENEDWTHKDVSEDDFITAFPVNAKASVLLTNSEKMSYPNTATEILYVIRTAEGKVVPQLLRTVTTPWNTIWKNKNCTLDIPVMPSETGDYTLEIYFNGALAATKDFKVTAG